MIRTNDFHIKWLADDVETIFRGLHNASVDNHLLWRDLAATKQYTVEQIAGFMTETAKTYRGNLKMVSDGLQSEHGARIRQALNARGIMQGAIDAFSQDVNLVADMINGADKFSYAAIQDYCDQALAICKRMPGLWPDKR